MEKIEIIIATLRVVFGVVNQAIDIYEKIKRLKTKKKPARRLRTKRNK